MIVHRDEDAQLQFLTVCQVMRGGLNGVSLILDRLCHGLHSSLSAVPVLLELLNASLSEGQEQAVDGAPLHGGRQLHTIKQVVRHVTNIECFNVVDGRVTLTSGLLRLF